MEPARRTARLLSARFVSFLGAQFLGAVNDNAFKSTLASVILWKIADEPTQVRYSSLATALFPLPFLLFSPWAGYLADRFRKSRLLALTKAPELLAMSLAVVALGHGSIPLLMTVLFLMATQSAFFSPPKYGLLPEAFEHEDLSMANGLLNMTTNLAILVGAALGVAVFAGFKSNLAAAGWLYLGIAVAGTLAALYVPVTPPGHRGAEFAWWVVSAARSDWREVRRHRDLLQTILGIAYFYFMGSVFLAVVPVYGNNVLGLSVERSALLLMILSVGVAAGSLAAGKLSRGRVEIGLVPLGSIGLTLAALFLVSDHTRSVNVGGLPLSALLCLLALGFSAGLYIVPLLALLQQRSPVGMKGRLIAFSNVLTFGAVLLAAGAVWLLTDLAGFMSHRLLLCAALMSLAVSLYILTLLPAFLVRLVLYLLTNTLYRIRVSGDAHVPAAGALLVANHVSWVDALLIGAATDRPVRFLMYRPYYEAPALNWFFRRMGAIPISSKDTPEQKEASLALARSDIEHGHVVCIFAEGALTRTGNLLRFRRGFTRIAEGMRAPILPVCLDGVWGSVFSWSGGRLLFKRPRQLRAPVHVLFGRPLPPTARVHEVRRAIQELSVEASVRRKPLQRTLGVEFARTATRFRHRTFLIDTRGQRLSFGDALRRALDIAAALGARRGATGRIGVLLPPGIPAALANLGALLAGRTVVNLDARRGGPSLRRQVEMAGPDWILTDAARSFARDGLPRSICLDLSEVERDGRRARGALDRLGARWWPASRARRRSAGDDVDATAAIVFAERPADDDGSAADRTLHGVLLSHHNILSNMESLRQVFRVSRDDRILGVLPPANVFGLFATLLLPAVVGVPVVYIDDPHDTSAVDRSLRRYRVSLLPAPAELLEAYERAVPAATLAALRHVVVAGGILPPAVGRSLAEKCGARPLAGFGCAECAPLISLEVPLATRARGQSGAKAGTRGHPLPGIAVRIDDPLSGDEQPPGVAGLLRVSGPNVMLGYVDDPRLTARVVVDGWLDTGYLARLDEEGLLTVLDPYAADGTLERRAPSKTGLDNGAPPSPE